MTTPIYKARSRAEFGRLSKEHEGLRLISQLKPKEVMRSASRWSFRHLLGFRLLTLPEKPFLEGFKTDHKNHCPVCNTERQSSQNVDHYWTKLLTSDCPIDFRKSTDSELLRLPGGFFWVQLARVTRSQVFIEPRVYPQRERRPLKADGFVNSTSAIPGSSPSMKLSSSEFEVDLDDLDEDEHDARRSKPEEVTVHFLMSFLQFALNLCLLQDEGDHEVRPRVERLKATIHIAGHDISAEDDGGICSMYRDTDGWRMIKPYLALIEAKRAFKYLDFDERTGKPKPVVSNETLAQYLAEAVISWRANRGELGQDVFLLAATNTFLRVIHFKFGSHYGEYIDATRKGTQKILVDDENKDTFVYMNSTEWFNLQTSGGRKSALCHILAIIRWHDGDYPIRLPVTHDSSVPEVDSDFETDYNGPEVDYSDEVISGDDGDLPMEDHSD